MNINIIKPKNSVLKNYVQYFLFFENGSKNNVTYTTFPNNNLCLAIYKNNRVEYKNNGDSNTCDISAGKKSFVSRLYGLHKTPFRVNVRSSLDQISILFRPAALRLFTEESHRNLMSDDYVFNNIFHSKRSGFLEKLFEEQNPFQRANLLETFLLERLAKAATATKINRAFQVISLNDAEQLSVERITKIIGVDESTLYRMFASRLGQNPKSYLKTVRFRKALNEVVKNKRTNLTDIAHTNNFFDQSHFIKDFKTFTGYTPKQLSEAVSIAQNELIWVTRKS